MSLLIRRARLMVVRDAIIGGGGGALWLLDGEPPTSPEIAPAAPPVAVLAVSGAELSMHAVDASMTCVVEGSASRAGVPNTARFVSADGTGVLDLTAGAPGSGAQVIVSDGEEPPTAQMWTGGQVFVTLTLSEP